MGYSYVDPLFWITFTLIVFCVPLLALTFGLGHKIGRDDLLLTKSGMRFKKTSGAKRLSS